MDEGEEETEEGRGRETGLEWGGRKKREGRGKSQKGRERDLKGE